MFTIKVQRVRFGFLIGAVAATAVVSADAHAACGLFNNPAYATGVATEDVELGDVDGDGRLDMVAVNRQDGDISVLLADTQGSFLPQTRYPAAGYPKHVAVGDFDGDGDADVAVTDIDADSEIGRAHV